MLWDLNPSKSIVYTFIKTCQLSDVRWSVKVIIGYIVSTMSIPLFQIVYL